MDEQLDYLITEDSIPEESISIGEFAKQTQLSLKALRLYHDKGLLIPAHVDRFTNYRYYLPTQVQTANYIKLLREMEMPLTMIEHFLELFEAKPSDAMPSDAMPSDAMPSDAMPSDAMQVLQSYLQLFDARAALVHKRATQVAQLLGQQENQMEMVQERETCLDDLPLVEKDQLLDVLIKILDASATLLSPDKYRLVGTTASVLHGTETPARSVDFVMRDRENVDAMHLVLSAFQVDSPPIFESEVQLYWASYFVDGVHVQVVTHEAPAGTDGIETRGTGPWTHFTKLPCGEHMVPTVDLELRLVSEVWRNRPDRVEPLIDFMRTQQVDIALLQRGMNETQIPTESQEDIINQLTEPGGGA